MKKMVKLFASCMILLIVCAFVMTSCDGADINGIFGSGVDEETKGNNDQSNCLHAFSEWGVDEPANCYANGCESRICDNCAYVEERVVQALGHNWMYLYRYADAVFSKEPMAFGACKTCGVTGIVILSLEGDEDGDSLTNAKEFELGTEFLLMDSDGDGLSDGEEVLIYETDPLLPDTDGDGATDKRELLIGFDPLTYDDSFEITYIPVIDNSDKEDIVKPSIKIELDGSQVDSLVIERNDFFEASTLGYMGDAYKYDVEGTFTNATVGFEFDSSRLSEDSLPTIYAYDEEKGTMRPLVTTIVDNVATTEVSEFATFVLLDRTVYENDLEWQEVWGVGEKVYTDIEIIFVIDDSGSMDWNDGYNQRLVVVTTLIEQLPENSKIGIIGFETYTSVYTSSLTDDKSVATSYLTTSYFKSSGGTKMYTAMNKAFNLYESDSDTTMKVMVVLSDGETDDTMYHNSVISTAISQDVHIYTVGLGSSSSNYFTNYLKPIAEKTGGKFYLSANAGELTEIYNDIGIKIDLTADTDLDGLSDYYEDNMVIFAGLSFVLDKTNPDTDGDGVYDGEEIKTIIMYSADGTQMTIIGKVYSDPTKVDSDGDGESDLTDVSPLNPDIK